LYEEGPERVNGELAAYLRRARSAGTLKLRNPVQAADLFLFMGSGHIRGLLKLAMRATRESKVLLREAGPIMLTSCARRLTNKTFDTIIEHPLTH